MIQTERFKEAPWYKAAMESSAIIGGVGNIGSWVSLFLARQGVTLYLYDKDIVGPENLASQLYSCNSINTLKTEALSGTLYAFVDDELEYNAKLVLFEEFTEDSLVDRYCFSCFDNMKARKLMFAKWKKMYGTSEDAIFIDGRLLAEIGQVFFVTKDKIEQYEATLFDDSEVALENCAYKGTTHSSAIIAGLMVSGFNNFLVNKENKVRSLPFNIDYQLPIFNFDIR